MLRILIADDHEVARRGIRSVLEAHPGWEVCAEAKDGRDAVELAASAKPDLVLLDIGMPNLNGLEAARQILAKNPNLAPTTAHTPQRDPPHTKRRQPHRAPCARRALLFFQKMRCLPPFFSLRS